jgi:hypothetical protein
MRGANPYQPPFLQRHQTLRRVLAALILVTLPVSFPAIILWEEMREFPRAVRYLWGIIIGDA